MCLFFSLWGIHTLLSIFFLFKNVRIANVLFINAYASHTHRSMFTSLPAHLAVVFYLARWEDEGVKGGGSPFISFGDCYRHMKQLVCSKNQLQRPPAPRLAEREEGKSAIVSIHRWALTRGLHWDGQMGGPAGGWICPAKARMYRWEWKFKTQRVSCSINVFVSWRASLEF